MRDIATEPSPVPSELSWRAAERWSPWWNRPPRSWWRAIMAVLVTVGGASCSLDGLLNSDQLPPNVSDPAITQTPDGARAAYIGTITQFRSAFGGGRAAFAGET